jgi:hypothetical protein
MKYINKNLIFKLIISSIIVFFAAINVSARVFGNGAGKGYDGDDEKFSVKESTIEDLIIAGGSYYLNSCRYIQTFLYLYELQNEKDVSVNYEDWEQVVDSAMENMSSAVETYDRLIKKAELTPYDETVTAWLMSFDYTGYMIDNGLNSVVFQCLTKYLKRGDITGLFKFIYSDLMEIRDILVSIKGDVSIRKIPEISIIRKLNESCSTLSLLGSYASRIFYEKNFKK